MAQRGGDQSKIRPLGQTEGPYGNEPYNKGRQPKQGETPLRP